VRLAVLRVDGERFDPDAFVVRHGLEDATAWRAGEPGRRGRLHETSGFHVTVVDAASNEELAAEVAGFLDRHPRMWAELADQGAEAELDVGVTVGSERQYTASVEVAPDLLARLAECGVHLRVSAYPSSDD
jgi:hypothetical protein